MNIKEHVREFADKTLEVIGVSDSLPPLSSVKQFIKIYPAVAKIYAISHLLATWRIAATGPTLLKQGRNLYVKRGIKRFDAGTKIFTALSKLTGYLATCAVALEFFNMGEKLGQWGLKKAQILYHTTGAWLDTIVLVGTALSAAKIAIDGRKWWKRRRLIQELQKQPWWQREGEYTSFRNYLKALSPQEEKSLNKALGVSIRPKLLSEMPRAVPSGGDMVKLKKNIEQIKGKIKTSQSLHLVTALTGAVSFAGSIALLFPPLHPLAGVLIVAAAVSTLASSLHRQMRQYQFEHELNLIQRPKTKKGLVDFAKWQIGWYQPSYMRVGFKTSEIGIALGKFVSSCFKWIKLNKINL